MSKSLEREGGRRYIFDVSVLPLFDRNFAMKLGALTFLMSMSMSMIAQAQNGELRIAVAGEPKVLGDAANIEYLKLKDPLAKITGMPCRIVSSSNLAELARGSRTGEYDVMWVPSHLAASALKHGFIVAGSDGKTEKFSIVVRPETTSFSQLVGKTLYLPQEDSLASYVGSALLSENGTDLSKFKRVFSRAGTYEVGMFSITSGTADAAIVEEKTALEWIAQNPGKARVLATSRAVPGQTLVFKQSLGPEVQQKLLTWFAKPSIPVFNLNAGLTAANPSAYQYVVGLGHYTPTELEGVKRVSHTEVQDLIKKGAVMVDVRSPNEYANKHIAQATLVSYKESSAKTPAFNPTVDQFDIDKLDSTKSYIFACNGPECWKSYKAAKTASVSRRFKNIYWFRGGLPEWEAAGLSLVRGS